MNNLNATKTKRKKQPFSLNWQDNLSIQKLLDVVVGIMAEEYIRVARENEGVFSGSGPEAPPTERSTK